MALIERTVGEGGDYATIKDALDFLAAMNPIDNDYTFDLITDTVEALVASYALRTGVNRNNIIFTSTTRKTATITTVQGFQIIIGVGDYQVFLHSGTLTFDNIVFVMNKNFGSGTLWLGASIFTFVPQRGFANIIIKRCTFIDNFRQTTAIRFASWYINISIFNNRFYNHSNGLSVNFDMGAGPDTPVLERIVENCSFYNCGVGMSGHNRSFTARNVVICNSLTSDYSDAEFGAPYGTYINCADTDNTLAALPSTNCITGIVPADEFQSLDPANDEFLFLKIGDAGLNATATPSRGRRPLRARFNSALELTPGAASLGKFGSSPEIADNDTDIAGNPRPGVDGYVSIGCHEQQYSQFEGL